MRVEYALRTYVIAMKCVLLADRYGKTEVILRVDATVDSREIGTG